MPYNWQLTDWPHFTYDTSQFEALLYRFAEGQGKISGMTKGLSDELLDQTAIDIMIVEAMKNSEIEGEFLSREDVVSSIRNNLGLTSDPKKIKDKRAEGMTKLMVNLRTNFASLLSKKMLFDWHKMVMRGTTNIIPGKWRSGEEPMQVVSGSYGKEIIHFEAPPSKRVSAEMNRFISWFNDTYSKQSNVIFHTPIRSAIAHLYFESIHPFEDGNGRIGRAISEKVLSQGNGSPVLLSLSQAIQNKRKRYYQEIQKAQSSNEITDWISYFIETILEAQKHTEEEITFTLKKTTFFNRYTNQFNPRQEKVIARMFEEGAKKFEGGMSAKKYMSITKTSKPTATRDLQQLVKIKALKVEAAGRSTRYHLNL